MIRKGRQDHLCESRVNRNVFIGLAALIFMLMLAMNAYTPLTMDDYDYSFSWSTGERLSGLADIFRSQQAHYMIWGGRSVTHFLAQLFLYLGKPVFNVANALMYVLLLLEIYALAKPRGSAWDWRILLIAHLLLFFAVEFFGVVFLWLDGACNYLWGTALALVPLLIARSERECGFFDSGAARGAMAVIPCFLAGWTNENTGCGILGICVLLILWDLFRRRRVRLWRVTAVFAQALGVALMLLAPGNFARAAVEVSRGFMMEMIYRMAVTVYCTLRYAGIPVALGLVSLVVACRKRAALRVEWLCILIGSAVLSAGALIGSPQISDRSFTGVIVLLIAALLSVMKDIMPQIDGRSLRVGAIFLLAAVLGAVPAVIAVSRHNTAWVVQEAMIRQAAQDGLQEVCISSVPSDPRYAMPIELQQDADTWPNSTMSKYFGIRILGK
ncbi:MAG: hypothetical protein IJB85_01890 [Clostridia bacterium]|nr:hypothetical protein [Clostridia bacterium]